MAEVTAVRALLGKQASQPGQFQGNFSVQSGQGGRQAGMHTGSSLPHVFGSMVNKWKVFRRKPQWSAAAAGGKFCNYVGSIPGLALNDQVQVQVQVGPDSSLVMPCGKRETRDAAGRAGRLMMRVVRTTCASGERLHWPRPAATPTTRH